MQDSRPSSPTGSSTKGSSRSPRSPGSSNANRTPFNAGPAIGLGRWVVTGSRGALFGCQSDDDSGDRRFGLLHDPVTAPEAVRLGPQQVTKGLKADTAAVEAVDDPVSVFPLPDDGSIYDRARSQLISPRRMNSCPSFSRPVSWPHATMRGPARRTRRRHGRVRRSPTRSACGRTGGTRLSRAGRRTRRRSPRRSATRSSPCCSGRRRPGSTATRPPGWRAEDVREQRVGEAEHLLFPAGVMRT